MAFVDLSAYGFVRKKRPARKKKAKKKAAKKAPAKKAARKKKVTKKKVTNEASRKKAPARKRVTKKAAPRQTPSGPRGSDVKTARPFKHGAKATWRNQTGTIRQVVHYKTIYVPLGLVAGKFGEVEHAKRLAEELDTIKDFRDPARIKAGVDSAKAPAWLKRLGAISDRHQHPGRYRAVHGKGGPAPWPKKKVPKGRWSKSKKKAQIPGHGLDHLPSVEHEIFVLAGGRWAVHREVRNFFDQDTFDDPDHEWDCYTARPGQHWIFVYEPADPDPHNPLPLGELLTHGKIKYLGGAPHAMWSAKPARGAEAVWAPKPWQPGAKPGRMDPRGYLPLHEGQSTGNILLERYSTAAWARQKKAFLADHKKFVKSWKDSERKTREKGKA